ncbi:response regulator (plasmid) [Azospirillum argentinense]|uniref:histidine kinase n=1 Tax=Azospirillum argentinense TaxID=2970906 RepID=A0A4D8PYY9_9PROT|nr:response regulator [Azospirillum argentinense]QCN99769.1 response regulator [Azospirillum argentinense]
MSNETDVSTAPDFLASGGEMGAQMRAFDWASTVLGPPEDWPRSLKTAVRIMLTSRQPIWIGWGRDLIYFYNDAYKSIIGGKHPWALGRPASVVWREIWDDIGPMLATAMTGDEGTYVEGQLLVMERNGYPEETYYTFSYSPVPDDDGSPGGIICANSDDTQRIIGERQLTLLRDLAAGTADARTLPEVCERSAQALATNPRDMPFALLYVAEPDGASASLAGSCGIGRGHPAAPETLAVDGTSVWPFTPTLHDPVLVDDLAATFGADLPPGVWRRPPAQAAAIPVPASGEAGRAGLLVVGLNPFRLFDDGYRRFLGLVAGQIAAAITNVQTYEAERRRAEMLAEIDRAKTVFFSNVSHEFRTPLTLMLGPLEEVLQAEPEQIADHREDLVVVHRNGQRLLKLVNALLDFSRIEAGRTQARYEPTDLASYTAELASGFRSACERAGLRLVVDCPPLPGPVHIDRGMWETVVLNLLSNAFKFTFQGAISVSLRPVGEGAELRVSDSGTGILESELPRLFERFHRVEGARGRSHEGTGIGLALVQELVKLHGGTIRVESEMDHGSVFIVTVPFGTAHLPQERVLAEPTGAPAGARTQTYVEEALRWLPGSAAEGGAPVPFIGAAETVVAPETGGCPRLLLADDNADMRDYVSRLLNGRYAVEAVPDGQAALAAMRANRPDLVLTDIMMPVLDGFGLLRAIREDADLRDLPVILLSARAGEEASVEGLSAGADDYLVKPFSARELIARVDTALAMVRLRREADNALRESEARFRNLADHAPVMVWVTELDGSCTYLNKSWYEFTGQTPETGLGFGWLEATHPDDRQAAEDMFLAANAKKEAFRLEYRLRRVDGAYRWAIDAAAPRFDAEGGFLGYIGSVIDITERKEVEDAQRRLNDLLEQRIASAITEREQVEAQLRQAQKMDAVGKLTGGVAHDFNNLLQVISGNLQLLAKDIAGNDRAEQRLQNALSGVSRGSKLVSQLLAFGRRQPLAPRVVNLGRLVRGLDEMLRRVLGEGVEIETMITGGLWTTFADESQVENALLNLAINARDAMNGHGRLTIEAGNAFLDDPYAARHAEVEPGQYVMLAVTDTGCGIPPDVLDHVFEPFFTTKPEGQGTGLGLSMVYGFVKQSGGHVKIYSEPGQGTTVRVYLPRAHQAEDVVTVIDNGPEAGGSETVLVVEDDDDVRATVVEMMADLGYRVLKARDAQSALAIVESGVPIDLLFTDVVMPGPLRSPDLARRAKERLPGIAVLFTSGYTENAIVHGGRLDLGVELLSKPYTREALSRKVRHVLRNQQQRSMGQSGKREATANPSAEPVTATADGRQGLRVLVVEDDALIRLVTVEMLTGLGHSVVEAGNAEEALSIAETQPVDALLTDISLPGQSGEQLAAALRKRHPALPVVFASGADRAPPGGVHLPKPYDDAALAEALDKAVKPPC